MLGARQRLAMGAVALLLLVQFCFCGVRIHGIDLGSHSFRIGYVEGRALDLELNHQSKRQTRSIMSLHDGFLSIGDVPSAQRFPTDSLTDFVSGALTSAEPVPLTVAGVNLTDAHAVSALFSQMSSSRLSGCLVLPAHWPVVKRDMFIAAAEAADIDVQCAISEPLAAAVSYAMKREFTTPEAVVIVAAGHSHVSMSTVIIEGNEAAVNITVHPTHAVPTGGSTWAGRLGNILLDAAGRQGFDIMVPRTRARLMAAAEDTKKKLTLLESVSVTIDALADGMDFRTTVTRDDFEQAIAPHLEMIESMTKAWAVNAVPYLKEAGIATIAVLPVGGSTRVPVFQSTVVNTLSPILSRHGIEWSGQLDRFVNTEEAAAIGGAFLAASLSPQIIARKINAVDAFNEAVAVTGGVDGPLFFPETDPIGLQRTLQLEGAEVTFSTPHGESNCTVEPSVARIAREVAAFLDNARVPSDNLTAEDLEFKARTTVTYRGGTAGQTVDLAASTSFSVALPEAVRSEALMAWATQAAAVDEHNKLVAAWNASEEAANATAPVAEVRPAKPVLESRRKVFPATITCDGSTRSAVFNDSLLESVKTFLSDCAATRELRARLDAAANDLEEAVYRTRDGTSSRLCGEDEVATFTSALEAAEAGVDELLSLPKCMGEGLAACLTERAEQQEGLLAALTAAVEPIEARRRKLTAATTRAGRISQDLRVIAGDVKNVTGELEARVTSCDEPEAGSLWQKLTKGKSACAAGRKQLKALGEAAGQVKEVRGGLGDVLDALDDVEPCSAVNFDKEISSFEKSLRKLRAAVKAGRTQMKKMDEAAAANEEDKEPEAETKTEEGHTEL